tara:strand:- start:4496 stop:4726 length:231 start_codon:yes stop_codon:yes gene_type:complete
MSNTNKLGSYIQTLMGTIVAKDEDDFVKQLALDELKRLANEVNVFVRNNEEDDTEARKKTEKILLQEEKDADKQSK